MREFPYEITLRMLGCNIKVICSFEECVVGIRDYFSPLIISQSLSSPDVILACNWEKASRYLFRSRERTDEKILDGVFYLSPETGKLCNWDFYSPPIPPFSMFPVKGRFVGLHASAIERDNTAILFVGAKGSGKSTTAVNMTSLDKDIGLITDETALIHVRTNIIDPFPRSVHLWEERAGILEKVSIPADEICGNIRLKPSFVKRIIILDPLEGTSMVKYGLTDISPVEGAQHLMKHHLDTSTNYHESVSTLMNLSVTVPMQKFSYKTFAELSELSKTITSNL